MDKTEIVFTALTIIISTSFILMMFVVCTGFMLKQIQYLQKGQNPVDAIKPISKAQQQKTQQQRALQIENITKKLMENG